MWVCSECSEKFHNGQSEGTKHMTIKHPGIYAPMGYVDMTVKFGWND